MQLVICRLLSFAQLNKKKRKKIQQLSGECMQGGDQSVLTSSTSYRKSDNFEVERLSANIWPTITLLQTIWIQIWSQVDIFKKLSVYTVVLVSHVIFLALYCTVLLHIFSRVFFHDFSFLRDASHKVIRFQGIDSVLYKVHRNNFFCYSSVFQQ